MTDTGTAADLAAMKIPELRKIAAEKGLKGVSGLRKGELIQAITTGQVPKKAAPQKAEADNAEAPAASERAERKADKADKTDKLAENADKSADNSNDDDSRGASRSAARRARRNLSLIHI